MDKTAAGCGSPSPEGVIVQTDALPSFGMTFTDSVNDNDGVLAVGGFKVIVDEGTLQYLRGVEIDFVDRGDGNASFVFNNLPSMGGGCGTCGSAGSCS